MTCFHLLIKKRTKISKICEQISHILIILVLLFINKVLSIHFLYVFGYGTSIATFFSEATKNAQSDKLVKNCTLCGKTVRIVN